MMGAKEMGLLVITGMIDRKRSKGRPRGKMAEGITQWLHSANIIEMLGTTS